MKLTMAGVTSCAAQMRSPSFSRSSSSATMTSRPSSVVRQRASYVARQGASSVVRHGLGVRREQPADVLRDHVRLDVHRIPLAQRAQCRVLTRKVDDGYLHDLGRRGETKWTVS